MVGSMGKSFLRLENINAYTIADKISDYAWDLVSKWDWLNKRTLGVQFVSAIDSVGGNIAEGFGRYHKKDKQKFCYNARGSLYEAIYWTEKSKKRKLINSREYQHIVTTLNKLPKEINWLIKITEEKLTM